jgi:hypothetical protein
LLKRRSRSLRRQRTSQVSASGAESQSTSPGYTGRGPPPPDGSTPWISAGHLRRQASRNHPCPRSATASQSRCGPVILRYGDVPSGNAASLDCFEGCCVMKTACRYERISLDTLLGIEDVPTVAHPARDECGAVQMKALAEPHRITGSDTRFVLMAFARVRNR